MTDTNRVSLYLLPEVTWGTTPSAGAWETLRFTGESLQLNVDTSNSAEIRADRNLQDIIRTSENVSGDINFELSHGTFDSLLEGLMMSSWSTNVLTNGTTLKSYSIEKKFEELTKFHTFKGCRVSSMNLSVNAGEIVTGSFSLMGKSLEVDTASASTGTPAAASTTTAYNAINNVTVLNLDGSSFADKVTSLSITVENNLRQNVAIGTATPSGIGLGQFLVTGTMTVYFSSSTVFDKFVAGTDSALAFTLSDLAVSAKTLNFNMPSIEFTSATVLAGGANSDVMAEVGFTAKYQSTANSGIGGTLQITRSA
jgi:hypothetical protein